MAAKEGTLKKILFGITGTIILIALIVILNIVFFVKSSSIVSTGEPITDYGESKCALLVVDIQEVITGDLSIYPGLQEQSANLIQKINQTIDRFVAHGYPVVYIRSEITNPLINLLNDSYAKGSPGVRYDKRLNIASKTEVVKTGGDSFRKTNLDEILTNNKISELYIVGVDAAECVNATVAASLHRKYQVNIIKEAVISKSVRVTDSMMVCFQRQGVKVIHPDSLFFKKL